VFPSPFDTAGAAAAGGVDEATARALTAELAAASLVVLDADRRRAGLLRPVRAHAASRLDAEDTAAAHERLTAWSLDLAAELDGTLHSPAQEEVVRRFVDELPVFRMVLRRLLDGGDIGRAALLFEHLVICWGDSPASPEARIWAEDLLRHAHRLPVGPRARLELAVVHCQYAFELIASKLDLAEQALAHGEAAGDGFAVAAAKLQVAAGLGWRSRDLDRAVTLLDESRAGMQALGHHYWAAVVLELQGLLALRRLDVAAGIATLEAAAAEHRAHGAPGDSAHALTFIGYARRAIGDLSGARRAFDEARRALGGVRVATWLRATVGSAHAALAMGDLAAAGDTFRAAHERAAEIGDLRIVGTALVGLAAVARREGDGERSVALLAAAADRALHGGDPTDAVTAAGMLAEMLAEQGADDEAAVVLGAAALVDDEVGVRVDFGLAQDLTPVRLAVAERLGAARADDLAGDGRVIGLGAAIRRAGERLLDGRSSAAAPGAGTGDLGRPGPAA
jgi:tetratricopeptide (TPR) repeat protein